MVQKLMSCFPRIEIWKTYKVRKGKKIWMKYTRENFLDEFKDREVAQVIKEFGEILVIFEEDIVVGE